MAQTFNDFVAECVNYGHSKEHYELVKECSELELCKQYLADQIFIKENVAAMTTNINFTESYFAEAVSDDQIQMITESAKDKGKKIWETITKGFKKAIENVIKFFKSLTARLTKTSMETAAVEKAFNKAELSQEARDALRLSLTNKAKELGLETYDDSLIYYFALSTKYVRLVSDINVVEANELCKILTKFTKDKKKYDFDTTIKLIKDARQDASENGVVVYANDKAIEKVVKKLEEVQKRVEEKLTLIQLSAAKNIDETEYNDDIIREEDKAALAAKMNEAWTMINETIGATIKQYGAYTKFRAAAISIIKAALVE